MVQLRSPVRALADVGLPTNGLLVGRRAYVERQLLLMSSDYSPSQTLSDPMHRRAQRQCRARAFNHGGVCIPTLEVRCQDWHALQRYAPLGLKRPLAAYLRAMARIANSADQRLA
jgi:hypothetical protein